MQRSSLTRRSATGWRALLRAMPAPTAVFILLIATATAQEPPVKAGDLARNTQDVVAVANRMEVAEPSMWDWGPA